MVALVGYTGFVGSNIYAKGNIDKAYNSKNIADAYGTNPDLLIYAGLRAEKYLANNDPESDMRQIIQAEENIARINPKKLVLISTIDVLKDSSGKNESYVVETKGLQAYGLNRYRLEQWVRASYPDALIIRLPGLFGINIKKNFIYDFINIIPAMLKKELFQRLASEGPEIRKYYTLQPNGFYKYNSNLAAAEKENLKNRFKQLGFTALNFTDSRNVYQFYPLARLWDDIRIALKYSLTMLHPATEPVSAAEVYKYLTGKSFVNEILEQPIYYDYRTQYAKLFGAESNYLLSKRQVLEQIKQFVANAI